MAGTLDLVRDAAGDTTRDVILTVSGCAYSCCGRGWHRRDGYEQRYVGYIDSVTADGVVLVSRGIGTISYIVAALFDESEDVEWVP